MKSKHHAVENVSAVWFCLIEDAAAAAVLHRALHEGLQEPRATVNAHGRWAGPKLLIGIILTRCNYSPETHSYCSGFNEQAITQPTIIITRTIKRDGYSLVKCSHMWRPHILLRTLADRRTQTWAHKQRRGTDSEPRKHCSFTTQQLLLYRAVFLSQFCSNFSLMFDFLYLFLPLSFFLKGFLCMLLDYSMHRDWDPSYEWPQ